MKIQVIGSGCAGCKKLFEKVSQIVSDIDAGLKVVYITDITKLIEIGSMTSPALVINEEIIFAGKAPDDSEIKDVILKKINN